MASYGRGPYRVRTYSPRPVPVGASGGGYPGGGLNDSRKDLEGPIVRCWEKRLRVAHVGDVISCPATIPGLCLEVI